MKAAVVIGGTGYNAVRTFGLELAQNFQRFFQVVQIIDLMKELTAGEELNQALEDPTMKFVCAVNGLGIENIYQKLYSNQLKTPFFAYLVDHPMYHCHRFNFDLTPPNLLVSCVDQTHVAFLDRYCAGKFPRFFVPHGASIMVKNQRKKIKNRKIDLLFAGTFRDPEVNRRSWISHPQYSKILDEIAEAYMSQWEKTLLTIAEEMFFRKGIPFHYRTNKELRDLLMQVDLYIRLVKRKRVIQRLSNLPIEVYGQWAGVVQGNKIKTYPQIDYLDFQQKLQEAKIVLNVSPNVVYGGHDRLFMSMLAGAVSLTERNRFLHHQFTHNKDLLFFDASDPYLAAEVEYFLSDQQKLQQIANAGREITERKHTWSQIAEQIIQIIRSL